MDKVFSCECHFLVHACVLFFTSFPFIGCTPPIKLKLDSLLIFACGVESVAWKRVLCLCDFILKCVPDVCVP